MIFPYFLHPLLVEDSPLNLPPIPLISRSLDFVLQLRAEEGMDTVLQSLVLLLGEVMGFFMGIMDVQWV